MQRRVSDSGPPNRRGAGDGERRHQARPGSHHRPSPTGRVADAGVRRGSCAARGLDPQGLGRESNCPSCPRLGDARLQLHAHRVATCHAPVLRMEVGHVHPATCANQVVMSPEQPLAVDTLDADADLLFAPAAAPSTGSTRAGWRQAPESRAVRAMHAHLRRARVRVTDDRFPGSGWQQRAHLHQQVIDALHGHRAGPAPQRFRGSAAGVDSGSPRHALEVEQGAPT